jgi:hypothetical protein
LTVDENKPFAVGGDGNGKPWRAQFVLKRSGHGQDGSAAVRVAATITEDGKVLAQPTLIGALGERMAVQVGDDVRLSLVVKELVP